MSAEHGSHAEAFLAAAFPEQELGFSRGEYLRRHRELRSAMVASGIDLLYLTSPEAICWATGYQAEWYHGQASTRWPAYSGVAIHADYDYWLHFETEDEAVLARITSASEIIHLGGDGQDLLDTVIRELRVAGWLRPGVVVGFELASYRPNRLQSEHMQAAFESCDARVVDATTPVRAARRVKSPQELAHVRTAQRIADIGMAAARDAIAPGVSELDVYAEIVYAMARAGGENPGITMPVASGVKSACVHGLASRRKIMPGDIVNVDVSGVYHRYHANMARTFSAGEPHPEVRDYIERSFGALDIVRESVAPGAPVKDLIARLQDYYESQGLWENRWWVGGYELGIAFPPDWVGEFVYDETSPEDAVFLENEVLNYEANFYLPKHAGLTMGINTLIVGAEGAEFLQSTPAEFCVLDG
ncbi:aminopeptidase P family protein [Leucobacter sp. CSA1]|uniref:Aminopeptidase P family protein n=1 Tax=Leucobacter chromiisoli TaxID=2796471 RepID=A0A934Q810_9MICO|nr:Xaa-Pro peptidase family protein [Leucobacter chromiisoli]MBK0419939.1 aminopeptidase P family protein [Leucobacter chromiisoli]